MKFLALTGSAMVLIATVATANPGNFGGKPPSTGSGPASFSISNSTSISRSSDDSGSYRFSQSFSSGTGTRTSTGTFSEGAEEGGARAGAGAAAASASISAVAHLRGGPIQSGSIELTPAEILGANPGPVIPNGPLPPIESPIAKSKVERNRPVTSGLNVTAKEVTPSSVPAPAYTSTVAQEIGGGQVQAQTPGSGSGSGIGSARASGLEPKVTRGPSSGRNVAGPTGTGDAVVDNRPGIDILSDGLQAPGIESPIPFQGGVAGKYIPGVAIQILAGAVAFGML